MLHWMRYFAGKAAQSVRQSVVMQLVAVTTIAVAVLVLAGLLTVLRNVDHVAARWVHDARLIAFLADDVTPTQLAAAAEAARGWPGVVDVATRSRAEARAELAEALGPDGALLEAVDPAVVPASIELAVAPDHADAAGRRALADRLRALPGIGAVDEVTYGADLLERLRGLRDLLRVGGLVVGLLVALAVVFIVSNTIRLALFARREELEIMQLVGATDGFIRAPCYLEGAFQGVAGGLLAVALLSGLLSVLRDRGGAVLGVGVGGVPVEGLPPTVMVALVGGAGLVAVLASHLAATRFLRGERWD
jgi:cell division transport system permease protein